MKTSILAAIMMLALAGTAFAASNPIDTVVGSAHDLSAGALADSYGKDTAGNGGINQVCVFCHTPHNANGAMTGAPLWSKTIPAGPYQVYQSASIQSTVGQPGPVSLACLSCHDGTIAMATVAFGMRKDKGLNADGAFRAVLHGRADPADYGSPANDELAVGASMRTGDPNLSTDLRNDHPVGLQYVAGTGAGSRWLNDTATFANKAKLFGPAKDQVECASCHEVHNQGTGPWDVRTDGGASEQGYLFLKSSMKGSALCLTCHIK